MSEEMLGIYKVLYVEDNPAIIMGVGKFLEGFPAYQLISATSWKEAQEQFKLHKPDILLLDQGVDDKPVQDLDLCIRFMNFIHIESPQTPIIIYSDIGYLRPAIVLAALRNRASYLVKEEVSSGEMLNAFFMIVLSGGVIYTQTATSYFDELLIQKTPSLLSNFEMEIAKRVTRGLSNKQIAGQLGRSFIGVRDAVTGIMRKIGAGSRVEIAAWYARNYPNDQWNSNSRPDED
jgi:DNA-binding NarL/FixJ family response regulator